MTWGRLAAGVAAGAAVLLAVARREALRGQLRRGWRLSCRGGATNRC